MKKLSKTQVEKLNEHQVSGSFHPYTCGNQGDMKHILHEFNSHHPNKNYNKYIKTEKAKGSKYPEIVFSSTSLIATEDGWICPVCDYKQEYRD